MAHDAFTCPALDDDAFARDIRDGAFGYNYQYLGNAREDSVPGRWDNFSVGLHRIRNIASTIMVADSRGAGRKHGPHSYTLDPPRLATEQNAVRFGPTNERSPVGDLETFVPEGLDSETFAYSPAEDRHNNLANAVFVDSHAESMSLEQMGYELAGFDSKSTLTDNTPIPVEDPEAGPHATNKLFNGEGVDRLAHQNSGAGP